MLIPAKHQWNPNADLSDITNELIKIGRQAQDKICHGGNPQTTDEGRAMLQTQEYRSLKSRQAVLLRRQGRK